MKFLPRAAIVAAVTFCAGAIANAATLEATSPNYGDMVQDINQQDSRLVPTPVTNIVPTATPSEIVQPIPDDYRESVDFASLTAAVEAQDVSESMDRELKCLAAGIYFEAKGEPLAGQLAVAEVILNRSNSGRYPNSVCSVITQPGQFSFVRRGKIPKAPSNAQWRRALAVAQVAEKNLWESHVSDAMFFHASYVNPRWKRARVGQVGNHIFYR